MSNKNNSGIPEIPNWLIIVFLFAAWPIGLILAGVKFLLPQLITRFSGTDDPFARRNRYSGYEKKDGSTVYTDFSEKAAEHDQKNTARDRSEAEKSRQSEPTERKHGKIPYKVSSVVFCIISIIFLLTSLVGAAELIPELLEHGTMALRSEELPVTVISLGIGTVTGTIWLTLREKYKLVKKYIAIIGKRGCVKLSDLASSLSRSNRKVIKELQQVIDSGIFGEYAYIDMGRQMFLRNSSFAPPEESPETKSEAENDADLSEYGQILKRIRQLDDEILDARVSERIVLIEDYTRRIFECLEKDPSRAKDVRKFMTYYLPTTLKLLESYSEIERVGVAGDNMRSAKDNIEKILDLLVEAYKRLLDKLYVSDSMDISTDIDVLEKMMEKDGLKGGTFGQN